MKFSFAIQRRMLWLNLPGALLIALLQRTPVVRVISSAGQMIVSSPVGTLLKSAAATVASLGAVHSLAGATELSTTHPSPLNATVGTPIPTVVFDVIGTVGLANSWQINGDIPPGLNFSGRTSPGVLNISNPSFTGTPTQAGTFNMTLQAWMGPAQTGNASPVFNYRIVVATGGPANSAPSFTTHPQSQTVATGANVTFTVGVSGTPTPTIQWRKDGANLAGETNAILTLTNVTSANAGNYTVVATNSVQSTTSNAATLTVTPAPSVTPTITAQPISVTVLNGQKVALVAGASGSGLSYQWRGTTKGAIAGATNPLFVIPSASAADADSYFCRVTNTAGSVDSAAATVTVVGSAGTPGFLRALSLRGNVGAGADAFFVGFVVDGAGTSSVLVKANGPGLATLFNVPGAMADPRLDLTNASTSAVVATNDNWGGGQTLLNANTAAGAFPLPDPVSKDAAMLVDLTGGTYIAKVSGVANTTGVALAEIYGLSSPANLRALSLRGNAGAGADAFFLGFVVAGDTAKTLLIKAVGPGLATLFNVPGAMVDPTLELTNASTSAVLGGNDNWGGAADLATANTAVGAFPLPDISSKDGAMLITLPPGVYIARVGGTNNTVGVVLVEIYGL
jgi:hypothetical protein